MPGEQLHAAASHTDTSADAGKAFFMAFLLGGIAGILALLSWWMPSQAPQGVMKPEPGRLKARYLSIASGLFAQVGESAQIAECHYYAKQRQLVCPLPANAQSLLAKVMAAEDWRFKDGDASRASRHGVPLADGLAAGQDNVWLRCTNDEKPCEFRLSYSI